MTTETDMEKALRLSKDAHEHKEHLLAELGKIHARISEVVWNADQDPGMQGTMTAFDLDDLGYLNTGLEGYFLHMRAQPVQDKLTAMFIALRDKRIDQLEAALKAAGIPVPAP